MINFAEVKRSIFGAWLLARFDQSGLLFFENSLGAFWRSYWAALLAAPLYITLIIILLILGNNGQKRTDVKF